MSLKKLKSYLPVRVFSIYYGFGWWLGQYAVFPGKPRFYLLPVILPRIAFSNNGLSTADGNPIDHRFFYSSNFRTAQARAI